MNHKMVGRILAQILALEGIFLIPPLLICLYDRDKLAAYGFIVTIAVAFLVAGLLWLICRKARKGFYAKEGMISVSLSWLMMSLLGCLPFYLSGEIPSYIDALFEMVSGFTTTGASILSDVESIPRGLLYWRSFSHWLGGMGVLVFLLAFTSSREGNSGFTLHLLRAESPGPDVGKLVPRMRQTAVVLYILYFALTVIDLIFLLCGGMGLIDALCTAYGTAGTGGFGIKNDSIAGYSPYIQNVCTVFMLLFGVNFNMYFLLVTGNFKSVFKDEELRMYFGIVLAAIVLISIDIRHLYPTIEEVVRTAAFQVSSIITTTGFATADFDLWPSFSKTIILTLMIIGACAGSTGGGLKCARGMLLLKSLKRNLKQSLSPNKVQVVRVNGQAVNEKVLTTTNVYLTAYTFIIIMSFLAISLDGFSVTTNFSAAISCFNNIGPGLEMVGPTCNYSGFSNFSKLVLIFDMLAGRLEIYPMLILFFGRAWKRK